MKFNTCLRPLILQAVLLSTLVFRSEGIDDRVRIESIGADGVPFALTDWTGAQWLWRSGLEDSQSVRFTIPPESAYFELMLELPEAGVKSAWFAGSVDDRFQLFVNGVEVYSSDSWKEVHAVEFHVLLTNGLNTIRIKAENSGVAANAAGMVGKVLIEHMDGSVEQILTGDQWRSSTDGLNWEPPALLGSMGVTPWGLLANSRRTMPDNFPKFLVPGHEQEMELLQELFFDHYKIFPYGTLWDPWMARSLLWPAAEAENQTKSFRRLLGGRLITEEGYVSTHQLRGMAHDLGWPFPIWTQIAGWGWHFSGTGNMYALDIFKVYIHHSMDGWKPKGFSNITYTELKGMHAEISPKAILETPAFSVGAVSAPFVRLEWWAEGLEGAKPYLEWTTERNRSYSSKRRIYFDAARDMEKQTVSVIPLGEVTDEEDVFTGFRIGFGNTQPAKIVIQALMTAADSRHNINNSVWIIGCSDYIHQTGDVEFIKQQIDRFRLALRYVMTEFDTKKSLCINTPWRGHDGRSGIVYEDGKKMVRPGFGVGNNYWDLLPFGGRDFLATVYFYDALQRMADLEEVIQLNPEWGIGEGLSPSELRTHAEDIKTFSQQFFWNKTTGRFVAAVDADGQAHDYGLTFLNTDAITRGIATPEQARTIMDWISGVRMVEGDTSQGEDIYHWRFSSRATTLRNTNYYSSVWSNPEMIEFGEQVQDGGAVLAFSYEDLMSRLKVYGPDNAWERLQEIIFWYRDVQAEEGVRMYYAKPGRGNLQGGGTAGGLGIDEEFHESAQVPQVMLYGFMGFEPRIDGFALAPKLPASWPSLTLTDVSFQGDVYDLFADREKVIITMKSGSPRTLVIYLDERTEIKIKPGSAHQIKIK